MSRIVAYYRVRTKKQGDSGLGLEAQRTAVAAFAAAEGFEIVAEFTEVETGKGFDALERRPELKAALKAAKASKCSVCVAKLDRLSRDVAFISGLMAQRVPFIVAALGKDVATSPCSTSTPRSPSKSEDDLQRTKAGLAAAKAKGRSSGRSARCWQRRTPPPQRLGTSHKARPEGVGPPVVAGGCRRSSAADSASYRTRRSQRLASASGWRRKPTA